MQKAIFILLLTAFGTSFSQNLVPNPSFEQFDTCPYGTSQIHFASPWFQSNLCCGPGGSSDYYNICSSGFIASVPNNWIGFQAARTGNAYSGIGMYSGNPNGTYGREYIEVQLLDSLIPGKKYCLTFFISLANRAIYAIDKIGAYFSVNPATNNDNFWGNLPFLPQIENVAGNVIQDTLNWVNISGTFVASGGEKYLTIGNFRDDLNTQADSLTPLSPIVTAYYCVDDVSLVLCDTLPVEEQFFIPTAFSPNEDGNNDVLYVRGPIESMDFYIYNRWGEKVFESHDPAFGWDGSYKNEKLNSGVFVYYFRGTMTDGSEVTQKGNITLFR